MRSLRRWTEDRRPGVIRLAAPWYGRERPQAAVEVIVIRLFGAAWLVGNFVEVVRGAPPPGLQGRSAAVLVALVALYVFALASRPWAVVAVRPRVAALAGVTVASALLAWLQPDAGTWQNGPLLVGFIAAWWLERRAAILTFALSAATLVAVAAADSRPASVYAVVITCAPWFLIMRLLRELVLQQRALEESRAAEARAAAVAERARLAREMHDVLAHSLSALALHLESTRLLAASKKAGSELTRAIDQAHQLAASGLDEARQALAAARGDDLPGPDRIGALADAFEKESGLPVALAVEGEPRELAPDARLAVYRTAQEALTNIRRHATPESVKVELSYLHDGTVLVIEDRAPAGSPPPLALAGTGFGLTGMRERAELLGGQLITEPTATGFRVELRLPA